MVFDIVLRVFEDWVLMFYVILKLLLGNIELFFDGKLWMWL